MFNYFFNILNNMSDEDTKLEIQVLKKAIHHFSQYVAENA